MLRFGLMRVADGSCRKPEATCLGTGVALCLSSMRLNCFGHRGSLMSDPQEAESGLDGEGLEVIRIAVPALERNMILMGLRKKPGRKASRISRDDSCLRFYKASGNPIPPADRKSHGYYLIGGKSEYPIVPFVPYSLFGFI